MKLPFLSGIFQTRASPKDSFWRSAYSYFFGLSSSGKTVNELICSTLTIWQNHLANQIKGRKADLSLNSIHFI